MDGVSMKLLSRKIVKEEWPWIHGEDVFDDSVTVPWMRLHKDYVIGKDKDDNNSKNH